MAKVTQLLQQIEDGEQAAANELLPILYDELRKLAAQKLASEQKSPSLQPTVLVHDAYLRLVGDGKNSNGGQWDNRGHFFAAAAIAMRRILIEHARRKQTGKHGAGLERVPLSIIEPSVHEDPVDLLALEDALTLLAQEWPDHARVVELRFFAGLTIAETSKALDVSHATTERQWKFAKAFLFSKLKPQ